MYLLSIIVLFAVNNRFAAAAPLEGGWRRRVAITIPMDGGGVFVDELPTLLVMFLY